ncbi:leucine--tRNA ligase [Haloarcula pellucida]|uniref:Leucine--tRNA ligase n=1 Tax=Haloarcula pellucida TaxID=1427151 RepID=A0A830GRX6_9EURY|nr:leucine--tRNA ligase [Halomicroarcula pellucida]MBX0349611.1 leucine--tRNA ligase [Halomicroarcula pellucida]GGO02119.1 leucine--tRNA ligase [Halomicroarcula pellucida]
MTTTGEERERGFDHTAIEPHWQAAWEDADVFRIDDGAEDPEYVLAMFPYTSGSLHMGHVRNYTITDAFARFERMRGENVLHPMGWDSFGLPAENAAEERDTNPRDWTMQCIDSMREQLTEMGFGYDWEREIATCEPEYYQWNQWLFKRFREEGLVERQGAELNWCPSCETVLADEQVEEGEAPEVPHGDGGAVEVCWRCDTPIEHREMDQWFFTITDYAEELLGALDDLDGWPNNVREMQRNWIGKQEGASVAFEIPGYDEVDIFTTRLDTIYGATYFSLAPGHPVAQAIAEDNDEVAEYIEMAEQADEDDLDVTSGVFTGEYAVNPATGEEIPVYVADYVLTDVGTGALYAVPAHDDRDHEFAEAHDIDIVQVVEPTEDADADPDDIDVQEAAYTEDGVLVNSGEYDGLHSEDARETFVEVFDGEHRTEYNLRDWGISRQRYWGTPIPMIHCDDCGYVEVPDEDLPVELPEFVHTTGNPLDAAEEWKHVDCPDCGGDAVRETDTMDTFVDSSWYFLRYTSPDFEDAPFDTDRASDWMPVDQYVGGIEHAVMHLLYARFFTKVLDDGDLLEGVREPFTNLTNQGMVLGEDGHKMSKSRGNGVSPQRIIEEYGADTARLFIMEAAQPEKELAWSAEEVQSAHSFLQNVYRLADDYAAGAVATDEADDIADYVAREIDATAARATEEYEGFRFNHALQAVRELVSLLRRYEDATTPDADVLERGITTAAKLLAPVAPHVGEEIWERLGHDGLMAEAEWPRAEAPADYAVARRLVENTREDVRDIVDTVGIENPETITLAVAPEWKHRVVDIAREADNVVPAVMQNEELQQYGEAAADFAKDLAGRAQYDETLSPAGERAALERAAWLVEREFDAEVIVLSAEEADESLAKKAEPGRPAIDIES